MVPGVDMRRGVQRCPGWAVESPETDEGVQGAIGQERPQPSGEESMINTGTHMEEKVLAKHVNMQVNSAYNNLHYTARLGFRCFQVAHVLTVFSPLMFVQLQRTFRHTTGHHSQQHRVKGRLLALPVQFHPAALGVVGEGR